MSGIYYWAEKVREVIQDAERAGYRVEPVRDHTEDSITIDIWPADNPDNRWLQVWPEEGL